MSACSCGGGMSVDEDGRPLYHSCGMSDLHQAAFDARTVTLRKLLLAGADVNERDAMNGYTPLHFACFKKNKDVVDILIEFHANVNLLGHNGISCLHLAADEGGPLIVKLLLKNGAASIINTTDVLGKAPLHFASSQGVARLLLDAGADLSMVDKEGWTPLHRASHVGRAEVVRLLLARGATLETFNEDGMTPFHHASYRGHLDVTRILIDAGADVNKARARQMCPLYVASQEGFIEIVKVLIAAGAKVHQPNDLGQTPLHVASEGGHLEVVLELLAAGADVLHCDGEGVSALYRAARSGGIAVVRALVAACAEVDKSSDRGQTALHVASDRGHLEVVLELLSLGADVLKCDGEGVGPLVFAACNARTDVVGALLTAGADVNQAAKIGETPLMGASGLTCVRLLLDAGASPDATDVDGYNALHYACVNGRSAAIICSLFKAGCDPRALTEDGKTPADVARQYGREDASRLLERLAQDALTKSSKSSVAASASKESLEVDTKDSTSQKDSETDAGGHKTVKPCAHCEGITHRKCAGCRVTHYCSVNCQRAAYAEHKAECVALIEERMEAKAQRAAARATRRST